MNGNNVLYIFKYSAIDSKNKTIDDFFVAHSIDECTMFLDLLNYRNIQVRPLRIDEQKPDLNKKMDLDTLSLEFAEILNSYKTDNNLFNAIIQAAKISKKNKNVYLRIAYFVYNGDSLSVAMKKLGDVVPNEIIEQISLGERTDDLINYLSVIIRKYVGAKKKKSFFSKLFKKEQTEYDIAMLENIKDVKKESKQIVDNYNAKLHPFKYVAYDESGKKLTGYFNAESIDDCKKFLEIQGFSRISVEPKKNYDIEITLSRKVNLSLLAFDLTQLSTYLKAGISLVDGVSILSKQATAASSRNAYQRLVYDLLKGDSLSVAMEHQGNVFPKLLINMIKSAEMTGDLPTILDDMAEYYEDIEQTKKTMKSALTYPVFVLILAIGVLVFMLTVLVPQFVSLYQSNGAQLPAITLFVISLSNFFVHNYLYILLVLLVIIVAFIISYQNMPTFKKTVQIILMKLPGFGKMIIYSEIYNFTKTFASLLNHGVFITDSMEILSNITNNEIYKRIIYKTLYNLSKGENISESFKGEWAFPVVAYHMIVTGESTGQLGLMMEKVSDHYKQLHKSLVDQLKSLIEPIMILIVAAIVGVILLSIVTPMFDIYSQIR